MLNRALKSTLIAEGIDHDDWKNAMRSKERIVKLNGASNHYWLKKSAPARGKFRYHALNLFSRLLRLPLIKAVPQPGGAAAIETEISRIMLLQTHGVLVPSLVAHDRDWLLLKDVGRSIIAEMKQKSCTQTRKQVLFQACLDAMKAVHEKQQYLSQAFIRNLLLSNEQPMAVGFIDFEDDPGEVMTVPEAQARDVLLLVNSTARFFVGDSAFFNQAIAGFTSDHDPAMCAALRATAKRMQWITRIPFQGLFGHDYQKLKTGILALQDL